MKPGIPWSVKGIDSEAREAAKHAARRSGMTLGEWLNTVIREQADDGEPQQPQRQPRSRNAMQDIQDKLDHLSDQLTRMVHREQDTAAGRYYERARPAQDNSLADILARVEASERQTAESFAQVGERLESLGDKLAKDAGRFPQNPEDVPGYRSLETAVRNIVDHIEISERKTRETLKAVQERLHEVAYAATAPIDSDRLLADAPVITRLESRLADLTSRVTGHQEVMEEDLRKLVQGEFGKLTQRLDSVKQASEAAAQRAQNQAVQQVQKEQRDFEDRMLDFLKQQQADNQRQDGDDMSRLRAEMESLGQRVDDLKAEAASEHDLRSLRVVIEQLSARVAQGPDLRPLADLDRRLTDITKWLEQGRGDQVGNQIADLEQRVFDLDNRIAQAMQQDQSAQAWANVEREFAGISDRLAHTEQQLQHIQTLEQSINQLYQSMEQSQSWARDMAEDAANRMASRLMQEWPARAAAAEPSPELQALESALVTVRNNYEAADQRNQETLGALHETLEQIVNKLSELEQLRVEPAPAAAEPVPAFAAPGPEIPAEPPSSQDWPELKVEATPEPYRPLDPPPAMAAAAAEPTQASIQADMIAAARRAAQAASSQQTSDLSATGFLGRKKTAEATPAKKSLRFSLFRRKEKPAQPKAAAPAAAVSAKPEAATSAKPADAGKRRRLILIGLLVLAAASALAYNTLIKPKPKAPTTPAIEQQKTGDATSFEHLNRTLAKSDAMFGTGNFASSLPGTAKTAAAEIAITDADALPAGIGTEALRQAALDGDARAAFIVASRFAEGKNVPQDRAAAARWFAVAAAKGLAPAQYRMGAILERGTGVQIDIEKARQWYERAAAAGNVRAMHNAAVLLANARSPKDSYEKAARWFAEAANHNLKDSQFNIALLYERGLGVGQDLGEALFWYTLAARQDDADAAAKAKTLENTLPKQVTQQVKARLAAFVPKRDIEAANVVAVSNPDWQDRPVAAPAKYDLPMVGAAVTAAAGADDQILEAQQLLNRLGFDAGAENGAMSTRTKNSIRLFELQSGMRLSGEVTPDLLAKLRAKLG
ncbi:MAG: peptidoglycan-binding protein [Pseudomonadota bacterium]